MEAGARQGEKEEKEEEGVLQVERVERVERVLATEEAVVVVEVEVVVEA